MMVMMIAMTPSLKASRRPLGIRQCNAVDWSRGRCGGITSCAARSLSRHHGRGGTLRAILTFKQHRASEQRRRDFRPDPEGPRSPLRENTARDIGSPPDRSVARLRPLVDWCTGQGAASYAPHGVSPSPGTTYSGPYPQDREEPPNHCSAVLLARSAERAARTPPCDRIRGNESQSSRSSRALEFSLSNL